MHQVPLIRRILLVGLGVFALAGCGGGSTGTGETVAQGVLTCAGPALAPEPQLPAAFPRPKGVTYVESKVQGPTSIVGGYYYGGDLEEAYKAYKDGFEQAGYTILFDEKEKEDAEVSYKDAAGVRSGQVALRAKCDNGNVSVRITSRPA